MEILDDGTEEIESREIGVAFCNIGGVGEEAIVKMDGSI